MPDTAVTYDPTYFGNEPGQGPLRVGGRGAEQGSGALQEKDRPDQRSAAVKAQSHALGRARDLWGGDDVVKARGSTYLPRNLGEDTKNYGARLQMAVFVNFFRRTIEGLVGLMFATDPVLGDDVPTQIADHWQNIDLKGKHGDVWLREKTTDAETVGHGAIWVEYPHVTPEQVADGTQARLEAEGVLRPYWIWIRKDDIMSWRTVEEDGRSILSQLVVREVSTAPDGSFGEKKVERYRVFKREGAGDEAVVSFELWLKTDGNRFVSEKQGTYPTQTEIPVSELQTSGSKSMFVSDPPLNDLAVLNVSHYRTDADYQWAMHKTNVPVLVVSGWDKLGEDGEPAPLHVGPNSAITLTDSQASAAYVAHTGQSLGATRDALQDMKSDMGNMGLQQLAPQKRVAETAEAKRIDKATSDSALSVTARGVQDAVTRALHFHGRYLRGQPDGGSIEINRDFEQVAMDPAAMQAYAQLINAGVPIETVLEMLKRGRRLPEDVDVDELALQMAAERAANEERQRQEAEQRALEMADAE